VIKIIGDTKAVEKTMNCVVKVAVVSTQTLISGMIKWNVSPVQKAERVGSE